MTPNTRRYPTQEHLKTAATPADIINEEIRTARTAPEMQNVLLKELGTMYDGAPLMQSFKRFSQVYAEGLVVAGKAMGEETSELTTSTRMLGFTMGALLATHAELRFDTADLRRRMLRCKCDYMLPGDYDMDQVSAEREWTLEALDMQEEFATDLDKLPKETVEAAMRCSKRTFDDFVTPAKEVAELEFLMGYSFAYRTIDWLRDRFYEEDEEE